MCGIRECIRCAYQRDISINFDRKPRMQLSIDQKNFFASAYWNLWKSGWDIVLYESHAEIGMDGYKIWRNTSLDIIFYRSIAILKT